MRHPWDKGTARVKIHPHLFVKNDYLWHISTEVPDASEDAVAEAFELILGQPAVTFHREESNTSLVSVYAPASLKWTTALKARLTEGLQSLVPKPMIISRRLKREDWAESWKKHFKPLEIGRHLLIKASWHKQKPKPRQQVIILDPGLSFGTGQHPTTEFCLRQLVKARRPGISQSFLDIGTGTGILAIAAVKMGYQPVTAFDFDPQSVKTSRENAQVNAVADAVSIDRRDLKKIPLRSRQRYDVICANVEYDILLTEHQRIIQRMKPDGILILAGILKRQFPLILDAYQKAGLRLQASGMKKEWHSGAFRFA